MSAIKSRNTKPEILVRTALHAAGLRYRLNAGNLAGTPDLVFPRYKAVVFVHGCFWHQHDCHLFHWPATREDFWRKKISRNSANDQKAEMALQDEGWRVATVWECALKGRTRLNFTEAMQELISWIKADGQSLTIRGK